MKKIITILSLLLSIVFGCSTKEEKKEDVREEAITQKQEKLEKELPIEINYASLKKLIAANVNIPIGFFEGIDIIASDSSFGARLKTIKENGKILVGELYIYDKAHYSTNSTFIGIFSKDDGMLKSYLLLEENKLGKKLIDNNLVEINEENELITFATVEYFLDQNEDKGEEKKRKLFFELSNVVEIIPTDTLTDLRGKRFKEFVDKFKNNQDVSEYQKDEFYPRFGEVSVQQVNYFETIYTSDDILVFRVRWSISDQTLESIWVYTVYGEFKSSCEAIYPFEDYGVKIKKESFDVVDRKKRKIRINIDWEEYALIADDEAGFYLGDKYVGKGEWNLHVGDDFKCSLVEENVEKTKLSFLDFIEKLKNNRQAVSMYKDEEYYSSFVEIGYGGLSGFDHLLSTDKMQVFRVSWEVYETSTEQIWVYDNDGNQKSNCVAEYPVGDFSLDVDEFDFKKVSDDPVEFSIYAKWTEYEVTEVDGGMPEVGDKFETGEGKWILRVDENFKCSFEEVEIAH